MTTAAQTWREVLAAARAEIAAGLIALTQVRDELDEFRSPASDKALAHKESLLARIDRVLAQPNPVGRAANLDRPGWTPAEVEELRRLASLRTMTAAQLGAAMGKSRGSIISRARRSNIPLLDRVSGYHAGHRARVERAASVSEPPARPANEETCNMNASVKVDLAAAAALLAKPRLDEPCIYLADGQPMLRAGVTFPGLRTQSDTLIRMPDTPVVGGDYGVIVFDGGLAAVHLLTPPDVAVLGGFHFAPGGNAAARSGGDSTPAINPHSIWDLLFRPACSDPRGMTLVEGPRGKFWCDIYLTAADHLAGTSRFGVTIADGESPPKQIDGGGVYDEFDYETAGAVLAHHGKQLLSFEEFIAAAHGVTERTARGSDPGETGLDAPRTSQRGVMQATGNMWTWGHDGDPDTPRASVFGGYWWTEGGPGSLRAYLDCWAGGSDDAIGARGRCDHLQPA